MSFSELLGLLTKWLERSGIPYMITGSLASSYHGEPRATRDIDVVIDPSQQALDRLIGYLHEATFYVDRDVAFQAHAARSQFNAIGPDGAKVDFIIRRDRPFSVEEFGRRQQVDLLGSPGFVATVEDVILAKLEWAKETGSDRQLDDVAGMVALAHGLDLEYIERWAADLDVERSWRDLRDDAGH